MGSPIITLVAKMFMEELKCKAISTATSPPMLWLKYVDESFFIQPAEQSQQFLQHINSIDPHIHFTTENPKDTDAIPFLDCLISPGPNNISAPAAYRTLTHKDQCLYWDTSTP